MDCYGSLLQAAVGTMGHCYGYYVQHMGHCNVHYMLIWATMGSAMGTMDCYVLLLWVLWAAMGHCYGCYGPV